MKSSLSLAALSLLAACGTVPDRVQELEFQELAEQARESPDNLDLQAQLGSKLAERGYHRAAIEIWESTYRAHPKEHRFLRLMADRYYAVGSWKQAIASYETLRGLAPAVDPQIHYKLGWAKLESGDLSGAQEAFAAYNSQRFDDADGYVGLGLAQLRRSAEKENEFMIELSAQSFQRALLLDDKHEAARFNFAITQERKGLPERAMAEYRTLIERNPIHAPALENLALLEIAAGRTNAARGYLQRALAAENDKKIKKAIEEKLAALDEKS